MHRFFRAVTVTALAVGAADMSLATAVAAAQAPAATAKPWSPARLPDGQPDVQGEGFWSADIGTDEADDIEKGSDALHAKMAGRPAMPSDMIVDPPDHTIPYTPAAQAIKNRRFANHHNPTLQLRDPIFRCLLAGVPRESPLHSLMFSSRCGRPSSGITRKACSYWYRNRTYPGFWIIRKGWRNSNRGTPANKHRAIGSRSFAFEWWRFS